MYPDTNPDVDGNDPNFWRSYQKETSAWWKAHLEREREHHVTVIRMWQVMCIIILLSGLAVGFSISTFTLRRVQANTLTPNVVEVDSACRTDLENRPNHAGP